MKATKILLLIIAVTAVVLVIAVIYKMIIEPAQLKKEYISCVENAKTADYERWQDIEKQIAEKDALVKKLGIEADDRYDRFLENNYSESIYTECIKKCKNDCADSRDSDWERLSCNVCQKNNWCMGKMRDEVYNQVRDTHKLLNELYKKRDANGEIVEKELKECEKHFKMFSRSY